MARGPPRRRRALRCSRRAGGARPRDRPAAFHWEGIAPIVDPPWQPTLIYPARGLELLWTPPVTTPEALARVVGRSRARLLAALDAPLSTTELARRLELTAGATSQHLGALRAAGLVTATRQGHEGLYLRTHPAECLLASVPD
jgi:DNA-binding transcriptional ArsR family regulator